MESPGDDGDLFVTRRAEAGAEIGQQQAAQPDKPGSCGPSGIPLTKVDRHAQDLAGERDIDLETVEQKPQKE